MIISSQRERNKQTEIRTEIAAGFFSVLANWIRCRPPTPRIGGGGRGVGGASLPQLDPCFPGGVGRSDKYHKPKRADPQRRFCGPFTSVVQKIALTAIVDQADSSR
jgi:hypothetical protein